ncbi:MAG: hypothetical protein KDB23_16275, partial [Planctomycetales bacterium]|nr:hypothetical protein [Planctomycetales bacterium]
MLLVRQSIPRSVRFVLGVLSICLLLGAYTWLSQSRQQAKRAAASDRLEHVQSDLADVNSHLQTADASGQTRDSAGDAAVRSLQNKREQLLQQIASLENEVKTAVDRTVPTWHSLYQDGLRRVLEPQGLRKDEYWLWQDTIATFERLLAGLVVGVFFSVVIGVLMGAYTPIESFFVP